MFILKFMMIGACFIAFLHTFIQTLFSFGVIECDSPCSFPVYQWFITIGSMGLTVIYFVYG